MCTHFSWVGGWVGRFKTDTHVLVVCVAQHGVPNALFRTPQ